MFIPIMQRWFWFLLALLAVAGGVMPLSAATQGDLSTARQFWSFQPIKSPVLPAVKQDRWVKTPVDQFILARLEQRGLAPVKEADKRTLIRRATFDLTGLPPTPEEIRSFLEDTAPEAFEQLVERLLASPRYGERWGRHWLDVVRYADTAGDSSDYPVPQAYLYRDYVIESFNQDKPYDQFVREQLAGDLMPSAYERQHRSQIIGTGFLAIARRFSTGSQIHLTIEDTIDTIGKAFLGLGLGCARCHDHKYDPVSMQDYYALYGIFSSTRYPHAGSEEQPRQKDFVTLTSAAEVEALAREHQARLEQMDREIQRLESERAALKANSSGAALRFFSESEYSDALAVLQGYRKQQAARQPKIETAYAVAEGMIGHARLHKRGQPWDLGEEVPRGFLQVLGGQKLSAQSTQSGRRELADWITDPQNPLTARVMVNRIWQHHFGRGLVTSPNDFGLRGQLPTHPELLDFLASAFIDSGWSVKAMHRLIMNSHTYQLAVEAPDGLVRRDPENQWYGRFERRRLDAEELRDAILAVSGALDFSPAGMHPFPEEEKRKYSQHVPFRATYPSKHRSVFLMQQRHVKHPYLGVFDGADPNCSTATRWISTTPLQALYLMNDEWMEAQARQLAARLERLEADPLRRLVRAWPLVFGRPHTRPELWRAETFLREFQAQAAQEGVPSAEQEQLAWTSLCRVMLASNEFVTVN